MISSITDIPVTGRKLVVRADLNAPLRDGTVSDATRIHRFAEGLNGLLARGARVVIISHLGRPGGRRSEELSLRPVLAPLADALGRHVAFAGDCVGEIAERMAGRLADGGVLLCENLRFHPGEEANDPAFARQLARLGDIFVDDAFSCAHRAHASTVGIAEYLPAYGGPLLMAETGALTRTLGSPKRPAIAVVGGAKVSTKLAVLKNLVSKLDAVIIGGGMANTFLLADGHPVGRSLVEPDLIGMVREIRLLAAKACCRIVLPIDIVCARKLTENAPFVVTEAGICPDDAMILDAGPNSVVWFQGVIEDAQTVLWNGPLGAFETFPFSHATNALARAVAERTRQGLMTSVAGGGDTVAALNAAGVAGDFTYVSGAGGAFLEWLEGRTLPGIAALEQTEAA